MKKSLILAVLGWTSLSNPLSSQILTAYIGNSTSNTATEINIPFNTVLSTIPVESASSAHSSYTAISSDGSKVYVTNPGSNTVTVINPSTYTTTTITHASFNEPYGLAISPDQTKVYVANKGSDTVTVLNLSDNTFITTVTVGTNPIAVAFRPDGAYAYVASSQAGYISAIDTSDYTTSAIYSPPPSTSCLEIAANPVQIGGIYYAYATSFGSSYLQIFDLTNNTSAGEINSDPFYTQTSVAFTPNGAFAYLTADEGVLVIDTSNTSSVFPVTDGSSTFNLPKSIAITPDGTTAYVTNSGNNTISIIDTASKTVTGVISANVGASPLGISIGYTNPLSGGSIVSSLNGATAITPVTGAVTGTAMNNTPATVYTTLGAYQLDPSYLPPTDGWVSHQTPVGSPDTQSIAPSGGTANFSVSTSGFSGHVQFDLMQTSNQVSLETITDPNAQSGEINIYQAFIIEF